MTSLQDISLDQDVCLSAAEYRALPKKPRRNKYGAVPTVVDGIRFHSALEAKYYANLKLMERAGEVYGVELQKPYPILTNGKLCGSYRADFVFWDQREKRTRTIDVKGMDTPVSRLKRKLVEAQYGIKIEVVKK